MTHTPMTYHPLADIAAELRNMDNDVMWKNDRCFKNDICITHGGSHFLEVVVPFIEIKP